MKKSAPKKQFSMVTEQPRRREGQKNVLHWRSVTRHVGAVTKYTAYARTRIRKREKRTEANGRSSLELDLDLPVLSVYT